ncbi:D-alanyl-D-alanine carboxypeptidase family protein [Furfurilactobacillus entadae]|uniref:D-alanyl-D-alanine carboxypeptidase family protein n=1 Tax=Furfurilactobacillus entadae TaxID=2922307 RepID=UPI0035ECA006
MKKTIILLILLLTFTGTSTVLCTRGHADTKSVSTLVMDAKSGHVYQKSDATTPRPVASISKLFIIYLALQKINQGKLKLDQQVTAPADIAALSHEPALANVPLENGQSYSVRDLLSASLIHSANGAIMLLAQAMYGNQANAVKAINHQAANWKLQHYQLVNVTGLNNQSLGSLRVTHTGETAENKLRAVDVATVAQKLLGRYEKQVLSISSQPHVQFALANDFPTENRMLPTQSDYFEDTPVDGLKTGSSETAGNCFVGTAKRHGHRLITVVLGADYQDKDQVFRATHQLMNDAFAKISKANS